MTFWAALGRAPGGFRAVLVEGTRVAAEATATSEAAALAALGAEPARVLRIGEGAPARLPAKVLPESGHGLPGFTQAQPADAIGGWVRLSLAGFLAQQGDWDGIVCALEGDVSHWVHLSAGEAVSSQSFLTPRLVAALGGAERPSEAALQDSLSRPERLAAHLRSAEVAGDAEAITGH
ncbi:MAG: 2-dehydro-3-deoxygalactonokinase, partial [Roseovarius sp.]